MRLKLICCEVFYREMCETIAHSPHQVDVEFLPKGLHDIGCAGMQERLQAVIGNVQEATYDRILLGYGLCNNGILGITARTIPIVVPRAHDCMAVFFGSRRRYEAYFDKFPGTYFLTTGWIERGEASGELSQLSISHAHGMDLTYEQMVEMYGEENAKYLFDQIGDQTKHYRQLTFLRMGIEPNDSFEKRAKERAAEKKLEFHKEEGNMRLIRALVNGPWNDDEFLVVPPGYKIAVQYDSQIIGVEKAV
jgi:hypothetical protein